VSHPLAERLRDGDAEARRAACAAIAEDPSAVLLLEPLRDALADPEPAVRRAASRALARLGRETPAVDALLLEALRGDRPESRFEAARALAELAPPSPKLVPVLIETLGCERRETAWEAARLLVDAGRLHAEVPPIVIGLVRAGPTPSVRSMAVSCLRELAPEHPEAAAALLAAAADPDAGLRRAAFTALPSIAACQPPGPVRTDLLARCSEAARSDRDASVRSLADRALALVRGNGGAGPDGRPTRNPTQEAS
jgi:HEAT repeat protein